MEWLSGSQEGGPRVQGSEVPENDWMARRPGAATVGCGLASSFGPLAVSCSWRSLAPSADGVFQFWLPAWPNVEALEACPQGQRSAAYEPGKDKYPSNCDV